MLDISKMQVQLWRIRKGELQAPVRTYMAASVAGYEVLRDQVGKLSWEGGQYMGAVHAMSQFRYDTLASWLSHGQIEFGHLGPNSHFPDFWGPTLADSEPEQIEESLKWFKVCEVRLARYADDLLIPSATPDPEYAGKIEYIKASAAVACHLIDKSWDALCGRAGILVCTSCLTRVEAETDLSEGCPVCGASQGAFASWSF